MSTKKPPPTAPPLPPPSARQGGVIQTVRQPQTAIYQDTLTSGKLNIGNGKIISFRKAKKQSSTPPKVSVNQSRGARARYTQTVLKESRKWKQPLGVIMRQKVQDFVKILADDPREQVKLELHSNSPMDLLSYIKTTLFKAEFAYDYYMIRANKLVLSPEAEDLNRILTALAEEIQAKDSVKVNISIFLIPVPTARPKANTLDIIEDAVTKDRGAILYEIRRVSEDLVRAVRIIATALMPYVEGGSNLDTRLPRFLKESLEGLVKTGIFKPKEEKHVRLVRTFLQNARKEIIEGITNRDEKRRLQQPLNSFEKIVKDFPTVINIQTTELSTIKAVVDSEIPKLKKRLQELAIPEEILPNLGEIGIHTNARLTGREIFTMYKKYIAKALKKKESEKSSPKQNIKKPLPPKKETTVLQRKVQNNLLTARMAIKNTPPPLQPVVPTKSRIRQYATMLPSVAWAVKEAMGGYMKPRKAPNLSTAFLPNTTSNTNRETVKMTMRNKKMRSTVLVPQNYWLPPQAPKTSQQGTALALSRAGRGASSTPPPSSASYSSAAILPATLMAYAAGKLAGAGKKTSSNPRRKKVPRNTNNLRQFMISQPSLLRSGRAFR